MLAAVFFVPIIFFYVLAHIAWRAQELRLVTQSMSTSWRQISTPL